MGTYIKACDIWAWGMTTLEVCIFAYFLSVSRANLTSHMQLVTGKQPFSQIKMPSTVLLRISQGVLPDAKDYADTPVLHGELWSLLQMCWQKEPEKRPDIAVVVTKMEAIVLKY